MDSKTILVMTLIATLLTACGTVATKDVDHALYKFCPISASQDSATAEDRIVRGYLALDLISALSVRNINDYSGNRDTKTDAMKASSAITEAITALKTAEANKTSAVFMLYRTDMLWEIGEAASSAISPAFSSGKNAVLGSVKNRVEFGRTAFINAIQDDLYLAAYQNACTELKDPAKRTPAYDKIKERINLSCTKLQTLSGQATACSAS